MISLQNVHRQKREKIQVELAQLRYRATKLTGKGVSLSRLGGGIGTRGPGEKKLEMDRRLIRTRISHLKTELAGVIKHREVQRKQRQKNHTPVVCIVRLHQCREIHTFKSFYGRGCPGGRSAVCHSGSDDKECGTEQRADGAHDRHGRIYQKTAASSGGRV